MRVALVVVLSFVSLLAVASHAAHAQPVRYTLQGDVPIGKKPSLVVTAGQAVTQLRIELARDDGKHFTITRPTLAKGKAVTLPVGDGASGVATYTGTLAVDVAGAGTWSGELIFTTTVRAPVMVTYDADHLDLVKHVLQFKLSRPAASAALTVIGEDGTELATSTATYAKPDPTDWLAITWKPKAATPVMQLKLRVVGADGIATNVELIPWSVTIDHEDVVFATDSAVIVATEAAKLDASLAAITAIHERTAKRMPLRLYVAGHTDTVGASPKNRKLSLARARAIATYFRAHGLALPIAVAGYGEDVPRVPTADGTDEPRNRRADYVIGPASGAPPFKGPYLQAQASWQPIK